MDPLRGPGRLQMGYGPQFLEQAVVGRSCWQCRSKRATPSVVASRGVIRTTAPRLIKYWPVLVQLFIIYVQLVQFQALCWARGSTRAAARAPGRPRCSGPRSCWASRLPPPPHECSVLLPSLPASSVFRLPPRFFFLRIVLGGFGRSHVHTHLFPDERARGALFVAVRRRRRFGS